MILQSFSHWKDLVSVQISFQLYYTKPVCRKLTMKVKGEKIAGERIHGLSPDKKQVLNEG